MINFIYNIMIFDMSGAKEKKRRGGTPEGDDRKIDVSHWVWDRSNDPNAKKRIEMAKKIIAIHGLPKDLNTKGG
jgi:hypothetical protein